MHGAELERRSTHEDDSRSEKKSTWGSLNEGHRARSDHSHENYHNRYQDADRATTTASDDENEAENSPTGRRKYSVKSGNLTQLVHEMQQKILALEQQLRVNAGDGSRSEALTNDLRATSLLSEATPHDQGPEIDFKKPKILAELHETAWDAFVNKFDDDTTEYAIEILIGEPAYSRKNDRRPAAIEIVSTSQQQCLDDNNRADKVTPVPDRIRINSPQILRVLASVDRSIDPAVPLVMLRPFKLLVHLEYKIKEFVKRLEEGVVATETLFSADQLDDAKLMLRRIPMPRNSEDSESVLEHMQCLVQFIDQYIKPTIDRLNSGRTKTICFRDLWYIFPPGEDIFMPVKDRQNHVAADPMTLTDEMFLGRYERMWRVMGTGGGRQNLSVVRDRDTHARQNAFKCNCYYIDFDGHNFGPIIHTFSIRPFSGERLITSLDFFPLRFLEQGAQLRAKSLEQGTMVFNALLQAHTHFYYRGPTLMTHPCGCELQNSNLHQDHVESEVIIDYRAALLKNPSWRPEPTEWRRPPHNLNELQEKFRVRVWSDKRHPKLSRVDIDPLHNDHGVDEEMAQIFKDRSHIFDVVSTTWLSNARSVPEDDVAMLSPRVFAFVLRTRTFAPLWLWGLQIISAQNHGLHNLQLRNNDFKDKIHALVKTHYLQKAQRAAKQNTEFEYDLVKGKGKGLIFLLHGPPGVGKTFTAESVAAANGRPLFQITCGDLGLTPVEVESALKEIFRYAQQWNCVLLLDECDIFLTQRTKNDLNRNSLVSVFLRVLEWYDGVLFLTTNRVGTLDSAVKSRITWSTYYPRLNLEQTREIWKANLNLLEKRNPTLEIDKKSILKFAREHFLANNERETNWNGRQIQNAFKVARSLAEWETLTDEEQQAVDTDFSEMQSTRKMRVNASQFEVVAEAVEIFEDYILEATGQTEEERAFGAQERADKFIGEETAFDDGSGVGPEVRRRHSSMVSNNNTNIPQLSFNTGRRPSNPQLQPRSRRSSAVQQQASGSQYRPNGRGSVQSPSLQPASTFQNQGFNEISPGPPRRRQTGSGTQQKQQHQLHQRNSFRDLESSPGGSKDYFDDDMSESEDTSDNLISAERERPAKRDNWS